MIVAFSDTSRTPCEGPVRHEGYAEVLNWEEIICRYRRGESKVLQESCMTTFCPKDGKAETESLPCRRTVRSKLSVVNGKASNKIAKGYDRIKLQGDRSGGRQIGLQKRQNKIKTNGKIWFKKMQLLLHKITCATGDFYCAMQKFWRSNVRWADRMQNIGRIFDACPAWRATPRADVNGADGLRETDLLKPKKYARSGRVEKRQRRC